jgi:hypothetical protein
MAATIQRAKSQHPLLRERAESRIAPRALLRSSVTNRTSVGADAVFSQESTQLSSSLNAYW